MGCAFSNPDDDAGNMMRRDRAGTGGHAVNLMAAGAPAPSRDEVPRFKLVAIGDSMVGKTW